jgi:hypothetical protein
MRTHSNRTLVDLGALPDLFPHRVARATELVALGLPTTTINAHTRLGGPWQRVLPGILLLGNAPPTRAQRIQAALRYAGDGAVLTGHDALQLHNLRGAQPGGPVHVLVPHDRHVRFADGVAIERTGRLPNPLLRNDFPVAPVERAVIDAARRLRTPTAVRAILAEAVRRGAHPGHLRAELDKASNRGTALTRQILDEITDGIRSIAHGWARRLVLNSPLPKPAWNVPICDPAGNLIATVDAWWDDAALAWQIDPADWHQSPDAYAATRATTAELTAAGITVLHTPPARIRREPTAVLNELECTLTHALTRPRPTILAGKPASLNVARFRWSTWHRAAGSKAGGFDGAVGVGTSGGSGWEPDNGRNPGRLQERMESYVSFFRAAGGTATAGKCS